MAERAEATPGPWKAQPIARGARGIWDDLNRLVAETRNTDSTHDRRPGSPSLPGVGEANAKLIAAAPDLLAALKLVMGDAEGYLRTHRAGPAASRAIKDRIREARAAIEAAEA